MSGTVNISRDLWDDKAFKPEPFTEREAWVWMIMEASYKPRSKPVGKIWVDTERGQLACSVRFMCAAWGWSKSRVDRFLGRLENRDMIGTDSGTGVNVITICKYDEYQNKPGHIGTGQNEKRDSSGTAAGQQRDKPNKGLIPDVIQEKEPKGSLSPDGDLPAPLDEISDAVSVYNVTASDAGWPAVQKMTPARRAAIKARLSECGGLEGWRHAIGRARASPFLCGDNNRGWRADFDFLTKQKNFTSLMEGKYDNRNPNPTSSGRSALADEIAAASRVAGASW